MNVRKSFLTIVAVVIAMAMMAPAQNQASAQTTKDQPVKIKHVPVKQTSPASGAEMFKSYCAACHGADGKGDGPAASALKVPPADLSALAAKNGGKYPSLKVSAVIRGEEVPAAHGSKEMPIWGNLFWGMSGGHEAEVQQRVANLNKYIESLQKK